MAKLIKEKLEYLRILNSMDGTGTENRINALCDSIEVDLDVWYEPAEPVNKKITLTIDGNELAKALNEAVIKIKRDFTGGTT